MPSTDHVSNHSGITKACACILELNGIAGKLAVYCFIKLNLALVVNLPIESCLGENVL